MGDKWSQQDFILSGFFGTWHIDRAEMDTYVSLLKEAGIELLIPYADAPLDFDMESFYQACQKNDMKVLTGVREIVTGQDGKKAASGITYAPAVVEPEKIRIAVQNLRRQYPDTVVGHYLWDEPGMKHFEKVKQVYDLVQKYDPQAFGYACLLPSYGSYVWPDQDMAYETEAAKETLAFVQDKTDTADSKRYDDYVRSYCEKVHPAILAQDYYPFQQHGLDTSLKSSALWKDMGFLRKMAQEYAMEYWHIFSGVEEWTWFTSQRMDLPRIRVQMNAALAYGCSGVQYFCVQQAIVMLKSAEKAHKYDQLKLQNTKTKNIGHLLFHGISDAIYHSAGFDDPASVFADDIRESPLIDTVSCSQEAGVLIGVIRKYPDMYAVVVNKDHENTAAGKIELKRAWTVAEFDAEKAVFSVAAPAYAIHYMLEAGDIAVYRLT